MEMKQKPKSSDPGWKYGSYAYPGQSINAIKCDLCGKTTHGGIYRHKLHLTQAGGNVQPCPNVTSEIRKEIEDYMQSQASKKKRFDRAPSKENSIPQGESYETVENDTEGSRKKNGEISMTMPTNVRKRPWVSCSMDTYLTHNDEENEVIQFPKKGERSVESATEKWCSQTAVPKEKLWELLQEIGVAPLPPPRYEHRESFLEKGVQDYSLPCHRCGDKDHTAFVCHSILSCDRCRKVGHRAIKCPARRCSEESSPPSVIIPLSKEISRAAGQFGYCGVLSFSFESEIGSEKDVVDALSSVWPWNWSWPIRRLDENAFLVEFPSEEAFQKLTELQPIRYNNFFLQLQRWSKRVGAMGKPLDVWIRVASFPLHCWDRASFQSLVASFGSLEELDKKTEEKLDLCEARLRISCLDRSKIPSFIDVTVGELIYEVQLQVEGQGPDLDMNNEALGISPTEATPRMNEKQIDSYPVRSSESASRLPRVREPARISKLKQISKSDARFPSLNGGNSESAHLGSRLQFLFSNSNSGTSHEGEDSSAAENIPKDNVPGGSFLCLGSLPSVDTACRALLRSPGYDPSYGGNSESAHVRDGHHVETGHARDESSAAEDIHKDNGSPGSLLYLGTTPSISWSNLDATTISL
ncbi:uncharacterized protein [Elaeis guineensis]|uniref:Uncharacterized protein LOC105040518 n=1 Tax=Elaeis guineensis var. tenera TaxID=51953 RepID=A0A6I9QUK0_ELAGV|nr:uncharacterized protein LOC105040518 [Elaeis guineensis]